MTYSNSPLISAHWWLITSLLKEPRNNWPVLWPMLLAHVSACWQCICLLHVSNLVWHVGRDQRHVTYSNSPLLSAHWWLTRSLIEEPGKKPAQLSKTPAWVRRCAVIDCTQWANLQGRWHRHHWLVGSWGFTSLQHLMSYQDGYRVVTVRTNDLPLGKSGHRHHDLISNLVALSWHWANWCLPYPISAERQVRKRRVSNL